MDTANFLFPRDLEVTPTSFSKILFIGSCLSRDYVIRLRQANPTTTYDYIMYNNASDIPDKSFDEISSYDLQYIQIPLRSVLTDAVIRIHDNDIHTSPLDWFEVGKQNIDLMLDKAMKYNAEHGILTFISNFIIPQGNISPSLWDMGSDLDISAVVRKLNLYLGNKARNYLNTYIADVEAIASSIGKRYFLDDIIAFYSHGSVFHTDWSGHERTPYWTHPAPGRIDDIPDLGLTYESKNQEFFVAVFRQIEALYRTIMQIDMVKVVIFDLDNTLWRGQLVEHYQHGEKWPYSDGWPLGIWEAVHHLKRRGIVVTLASKNDESLVVKKWDDAVQPPFVKYEDFLIPKVNWDSKAENIKSILSQLALTPKSALFVDDNPVERESVKSQIPDIRVIGSDPFVTRRILLWAPETQLHSRTSETLQRERLLKKQIDRNHDQASLTREEFLSSLETSIKTWRLTSTDHPTFSRVSELVNKTNQFNTTGARWTGAEYNRYFNNGGVLYAFSTVDRYAEYGTVGAVFVQDQHINQFIMSCRVMGMEIEFAVLSFIVDSVRQHSTDVITASIVETESNTPCRTLYERALFDKRDSNHFEIRPDQSLYTPAHVSIMSAD